MIFNIPHDEDIQEIKGSLNAITPFDSEPTSGSLKGVTSNAVFAALNALIKRRTFTATLYDYNTYKASIPNQDYFKIGDLVIVLIEFQWDNYSDLTFDTLVELRDLPCNTLTGFIQAQNLATNGADRVIQGSGQWAYIRPNLITSQMTGMTGYFQAVIFGTVRSGYPYD